MWPKESAPECGVQKFQPRFPAEESCDEPGLVLPTSSYVGVLVMRVKMSQ